MNKRRSHPQKAFHRLPNKILSEHVIPQNGKDVCFSLIEDLLAKSIEIAQTKAKYRPLVTNVISLTDNIVQENMFIPQQTTNTSLKEDIPFLPTVKNISLPSLTPIVSLINSQIDIPRFKKSIQIVSQKPYKSIALPSIINEEKEDQIEEEIEIIRKRKYHKQNMKKTSKLPKISFMKNNNLPLLVNKNSENTNQHIQEEIPLLNTYSKFIKQKKVPFVSQTPKNLVLKNGPLYQKIYLSKISPPQETRLPPISPQFNTLLLQRFKQTKGIKIRQSIGENQLIHS